MSVAVGDPQWWRAHEEKERLEREGRRQRARQSGDSTVFQFLLVEDYSHPEAWAASEDDLRTVFAHRWGDDVPITSVVRVTERTQEADLATIGLAWFSVPLGMLPSERSNMVSRTPSPMTLTAAKDCTHGDRPHHPLLRLHGPLSRPVCLLRAQDVHSPPLRLLSSPRVQGSPRKPL